MTSARSAKRDVAGKRKKAQAPRVVVRSPQQLSRLHHDLDAVIQRAKEGDRQADETIRSYHDHLVTHGQEPDRRAVQYVSQPFDHWQEQAARDVSAEARERVVHERARRMQRNREDVELENRHDRQRQSLGGRRTAEKTAPERQRVKDRRQRRWKQLLVDPSMSENDITRTLADEWGVTTTRVGQILAQFKNTKTR